MLVIYESSRNFVDFFRGKVGAAFSLEMQTLNADFISWCFQGQNSLYGMGLPYLYFVMWTDFT